MIYRIRWSWKNYKGRPFATFLSFFFNVSFLITAIGIFVFIMGLSGHDSITIIIGSSIITLMIIYFSTSRAYLKKIDMEIESKKEQLEKQKLILQFQECKIKYPNFDINQEIKNDKFVYLINSLGYPIINAYEEVHNIKKLN